jgi:hypothetical protein
MHKVPVESRNKLRVLVVFLALFVLALLGLAPPA